MKSKKELSAEILNRIKTITQSAIDHENYEKALAAMITYNKLRKFNSQKR